MNRKQLIEAMAELSGDSKESTDRAVAAFCQVVSRELVSGNRITISNFGAFDTRYRGELHGNSPLAGAFKVGARRHVLFKPSDSLKQKLRVEEGSE